MIGLSERASGPISIAHPIIGNADQDLVGELERECYENQVTNGCNPIGCFNLAFNDVWVIRYIFLYTQTKNAINI